jgi:hypothetical protein
MAVARGKINVSGFSNEVSVFKAVYDFAVDGGAVAVFDLMEMKEAMTIVGANVDVNTTCTSGGAATVEFGIKAGDTDAILAATAVASLTANKSFNNVVATSSGLYVASAAVLAMEIKVAALTAGKMTLVVFARPFSS